MILGVDFDNTLVCYDGLFHMAAVAKGLMPGNGPHDKDGVRNWLIERGREADFTRLQGEVYGPGLRNAPAYPGARESLANLIGGGWTVYIISHKTKQPVLGPAHDLRKAALGWLETKEFFAPGLLNRERVFFEDTMEAKASRIAALGCSHFIDDMRRFLDRDDFPGGIGKLWFRPASGLDASDMDYPAFSSWPEIGRFLTKAALDG